MYTPINENCETAFSVVTRLDPKGFKTIDSLISGFPDDTRQAVLEMYENVAMSRENCRKIGVKSYSRLNGVDSNGISDTEKIRAAAFLLVCYDREINLSITYPSKVKQ